MSEKKLMAAVCCTPEDEKEISQECVRCCFDCGCDAELVAQAKAVGFSFASILALVLTYGPVAVKILQQILDQLKQVAPLDVSDGVSGKKKK